MSKLLTVPEIAEVLHPMIPCERDNLVAKAQRDLSDRETCRAVGEWLFKLRQRTGKYNIRLKEEMDLLRGEVPGGKE